MTLKLEIVTSSPKVKAILRMIQHLKKPGFHYFFIDELFKGTNTIERIGSGLRIVRWLAAKTAST